MNAQRASKQRDGKKKGFMSDGKEWEGSMPADDLRTYIGGALNNYSFRKKKMEILEIIADRFYRMYSSCYSFIMIFSSTSVTLAKFKT